MRRFLGFYFFLFFFLFSIPDFFIIKVEYLFIYLLKVHPLYWAHMIEPAGGRGEENGVKQIRKWLLTILIAGRGRERERRRR